MTTEQDERRVKAALAACEGIPTEALERGIVRELYAFAATMALADMIGRNKGGDFSFPAGWWHAHVRQHVTMLNAACSKAQTQ